LDYALAINPDFTLHLWNRFKKAHGKPFYLTTLNKVTKFSNLHSKKSGKQYMGPELESYRFGIFKNNVETIQKHNQDYAAGIHTYRLGLNEFADWTVEEFRERFLGTRLNLADRRHPSVRLGSFTRLPEFVSIPDNVDWRENGAVTPVKNQGSCGSCKF
jgi:C1A family cysteine protease